ncbi:MAG TPA: response regulator transcription factor [bacterium]|nr:response regulator transcription factor [bacterium]
MKAETTAQPKVLVVDDHPIVRHGMVLLLKHSRQFKVCGEAASPAETSEKVASSAPDLLLIDLFLGGVIAIDTIRQLRRSHPELGILVISMQNEAFYAQKALDAGADGYIVKEEASDRILHALRRVAEGKTYISFPVLKKMLYRYAEDRKAPEKDAVLRLSDREFQVFRMMGEGLGTRRIAEELGVGIKTIETYCTRLKKKLDLKNATELLRHALAWQGPEGM